MEKKRLSGEEWEEKQSGLNRFMYEIVKIRKVRGRRGEGEGWKKRESGSFGWFLTVSCPLAPLSFAEMVLLPGSLLPPARTPVNSLFLTAPEGQNKDYPPGHCLLEQK